MFELNGNITVQEFLVEDSPVYIIDNFYKNPEEIVNFLLEIEPEFHKKDEYPSFNSVYFEDKRHDIQSNEVIKVYEFLSNLCGQNYESSVNQILSNFF